MGQMHLNFQEVLICILKYKIKKKYEIYKWNKKREELIFSGDFKGEGFLST